MIEEWKDIPSYEGFYQASTLGNIRSVDRIFYSKGRCHKRKSKILKSSPSNGGYLVLTLSKAGVYSQKVLHKLIAITWLNHKPCGHELVIDHINGEKTDNRVCNLREITQSENVKNTDKYRSAKQYKQPKVGVEYKGYFFRKDKDCYVARIKMNGVLYSKHCQTESEAIEIRKAMINFRNEFYKSDWSKYKT